MFRQQNAGQNYNALTANESLEDVAKFKYFENSKKPKFHSLRN